MYTVYGITSRFEHHCYLLRMDKGFIIGSIMFLWLILFVQSKPISVIELKARLVGRINNAPKNGVNCPNDLKIEIADLVDQMERKNPTKNPACSSLMKGSWKMMYTDFSPAAPSSGKLGPFIGDVYQDLTDGILTKTKLTKGVRRDEGSIRNILKIAFPPISGALYYSLNLLFSYV